MIDIISSGVALLITILWLIWIFKHFLQVSHLLEARPKSLLLIFYIISHIGWLFIAPQEGPTILFCLYTMGHWCNIFIHLSLAHGEHVELLFKLDLSKQSIVW